jgi:hypothetical protein
MNPLPHYPKFYSFNINKKENLVVDYTTLFYNSFDNNQVNNYIRNEIIQPKERKTVQWSSINNIGETYSKFDYDRSIDSQQISQNLNEYRAMKQIERTNMLLLQKQQSNIMGNMFQPFYY